MLKPLDSLMLVHVPIPDIEDVEFVAKIHSSDMLTTYYDKVLSSLRSRLSGRIRRLQEEFQPYGYNILIGDALNNVELLECFDAITSNKIDKFYALKAEKLVVTATSIDTDIAIIGANANDFKAVVDEAIGTIFPTAKADSARLKRSSLLDHLLPISKTSIAISSVL
jgi:hypothetical protein